ncbi:MAG: TonB-dependent receptor [Pseudomonadota bacterium]
MICRRIALLFILGGAFLLLGEQSDADTSLPSTFASFGVSTAYRRDALQWNIAGDTEGKNPNILSELTWSDIEIFEIKASGDAIIEDFWYLRGSFGYGEILDGRNQDSDYDGDDRTEEFSRSDNSTDNGDVFDCSIGTGVWLNLWKSGVFLAPLIGYSHNEQRLTMSDLYQSVSRPDKNLPAVGPVEGLNSSYDTRWEGPWTGMDIIWMPARQIRLFAGFEYHWADYYAEADWNLKPDFKHPVSYTHEADGTGTIISCGLEFQITDSWLVYTGMLIEDWYAESGSDRIYNANGTTVDTRLNEVAWESQSIMLAMTYRFVLEDGL